MSEAKRFRLPEPKNGTERYEKNKSLLSGKRREVDMFAVLKHNIESKIECLEKMCLSAEYISEYEFHTKARTEISELKITLAGAEREYHIKRFAFDVALRELDFGKYNCDREVKGWTTEHYWEYMGRHNGGMEVNLLGPVHL